MINLLAILGLKLTGLWFWIFAGFLAGSLPLAVWMGHVFLRVDIRDFGDGNPGAANLWRAGGWRWGSAGVALEVAKSAVPTYLASTLGSQRGWSLAAIALAPVFGHAFSPWLRFRGGKAIATVFGAWFAVLGLVGLLGFGLSLGLMYAWQSSDAWTVVLGAFCFLVFLLVGAGATRPLLGLWFGTTAVLIYRHWSELKHLPRLRSWLPIGRRT